MNFTTFSQSEMTGTISLLPKVSNQCLQRILIQLPVKRQRLVNSLVHGLLSGPNLKSLLSSVK